MCTENSKTFLIFDFYLIKVIEISETIQIVNTRVRRRSTRKSSKKQQDLDSYLYESDVTKLSESIESCKDDSSKYFH